MRYYVRLMRHPIFVWRKLEALRDVRDSKDPETYQVQEWIAHCLNIRRNTDQVSGGVPWYVGKPQPCKCSMETY